MSLPEFYTKKAIEEGLVYDGPSLNDPKQGPPYAAETLRQVCAKSTEQKFIDTVADRYETDGAMPDLWDRRKQRDHRVTGAETENWLFGTDLRIQLQKLAGLRSTNNATCFDKITKEIERLDKNLKSASKSLRHIYAEMEVLKRTR